MAITAADVKKLRDATGAGMMDAKKALTEANGDFDQAVEGLRISGLAKQAKRADREATNGIVAGRGGALIQFAAETDFVAKNAEFVGLADEILSAVLESGATDVASTNAATLPSGTTVEDAVKELGAKIGENISVANAANFDGETHLYLHRRAADLPPQVGVLVEYTGDSAAAHQVAMQIAAMSPQYVTREDVPADIVENEKRIAEATAKEEGKPEGAIPRIVEGRVGGFYKDVVLVDQPAVWEDKKTVGDALKASGTEVQRFVRFSVG
ncbi:translation elongation factor Ts [Tessaracoccus flavus]|jgi:elongation factor Ts|uniref:Elongation factor Ts n=1 Tax=Tessaracoccus flavus TaxID=1610493 RepID=A0A1Q2CDI0_9ACTN|nr:translation elongation factor Ts [Tessaracoccus flavus]AQP44164.1 translation elongation factor Ts [Tessaracoccus flavus]SDY37053.1 translation elongation factor Ts (EF-Ts) [Tessaracoccus flavus]